nr:probable serine/threonine-protein kinase dyrk2 isoform X2 [Ciona intestinalis]|eukprot:XP_002131222.1 probable serine/threonine-protein kinase dyrk2 isoform X2 [Ciona intestinalis]
MKDGKESLADKLKAPNIPLWQKELIQKKRAAQKKRSPEKAFSVPEWKTELLKRLHSKTELTVENKMENSSDKNVDDGHIVKVSDNVFMRQEQKRKASVSQTVNHVSNQNQVVPPLSPGYHVTRTDNIIIIERDDELNKVLTSDSQSAQSVVPNEKIDEEMPSAGIVSRLKNKFKESSNAPAVIQRSASLENPILTENKQVKSPTKSDHSLTFSLPARSVSQCEPLRSPQHNNTLSSNKINSSTHTVTSPTSKTVSSPEKETIKIDTSGLHAPGIAATSDVSRQKVEKVTSSATPCLTSKPSIPLRSGSIEKKPSNKKAPTQNAPPQTTNNKKESLNDDFSTSSKALHENDKNSKVLTGSLVPNQFEKQSSQVQPNKSNKENFEIVNLGKTSLDPSTLKSKAAIMANEIMKESKTICIIPNRQSQTPDHKDVTTNSIPSSSVDDVITDQIPIVPIRKKKHVHTKLISDTLPVGSILVQNEEPKKSTAPTPSNNATGLLFGKRGIPSKGFGGGNSFVVDPRKFKRGNPSPNTTIKKQNPPNESTNTEAIAPESVQHNKQVCETDAPPKGKRKLTVDQITVIGGYVKLDRPTLVSTKKTKDVTRHVKFDSEHMESTFHYPSENSLLNESGMKGNIMNKPAYGKESSLGKYTPKYLLSMKETLDGDLETDTVSEVNNEEEEMLNAVPLKDEDASAFSSSSADLLF